MKDRFLFLCLLFFSGVAFGQEEEHETFHPHHSLGFVISHTQVSEGVGSDGRKKWLSLPSWGINYNYTFSPKWSIGLHNDIITESFEVEEHLESGGENNVVERRYPIASAVMASFKPGKHFSYIIGAGGEFAHAANYFLIRIGVEYSYEINHHWELVANITNDLKVNAYNSWSVGMGITRVF